jgi:hypothetical protein
LQKSVPQSDFTHNSPPPPSPILPPTTHNSSVNLHVHPQLNRPEQLSITFNSFNPISPPRALGKINAKQFFARAIAPPHKKFLSLFTHETQKKTGKSPPPRRPNKRKAAKKNFDWLMNMHEEEFI